MHWIWLMNIEIANSIVDRLIELVRWGFVAVRWTENSTMVSWMNEHLWIHDSSNMWFIRRKYDDFGRNFFRWKTRWHRKSAMIHSRRLSTSGRSKNFHFPHIRNNFFSVLPSSKHHSALWIWYIWYIWYIWVWLTVAAESFRTFESSDISKCLLSIKVSSAISRHLLSHIKVLWEAVRR